MVSWRRNYIEQQATDSVPATSGVYKGSGAVIQTPMGTRKVDNFDDRVTYEASIYTDTPQAVSRKFMGNNIGDGATVTRSRGRFQPNPNPTRQANLPPREDVDAVIVNVGHGGSYDETQYRPWAGYPLSGNTDLEHANATNDIIGSSVNQPHQMVSLANPHTLAEKIQYPGDKIRLSGMPSQVAAERPWDTVLGRWPWTGGKAAQPRPVTAQPLNFPAMRNPLPSPTGAGSQARMYNDLSVKRLTFRVAPAPWDSPGRFNTGDNVDSGN